MIKIDEKGKKNLYKDFSKIFSAIQYTSEQKDIPFDKLKGFMDISNICMLVPKKRWLKRFLIDNFDIKESKPPLINLSYRIDKDDLASEQVSKYSGEYLNHILLICKHYDSVKFKLKRDYPLTIETEDFYYILAPRVGD